jgi:nucleoside-diphosphate-sugar epimerase
MVKAVISILTAAAAQPTVKNFVLTSSSYACFWPKPNVEFDIGEDMWNEESVEKAYSLAETDPLKPWHIYAGHKVLVERAAWKFMKEEKPAFSMNAIMPNTTFGPILDPAQATSTAGMLKGLFESNWAAFSGILPRKSSFTFIPLARVIYYIFTEWGVDVRDVGRLHMLALTSPSLSAGGIRMYAASEPFNTNDILQLFRKLYPGKTFLPDIEGLGRDLTHVDNKRAGELLGGWIKFEESIKANTENL